MDPDMHWCGGFVPDCAIEYICERLTFKVRCQTHQYFTYVWKKINFSLSDSKNLTYFCCICGFLAQTLSLQSVRY